MKQLLILSDSHGCYALVQKALEAEPRTEGLIFLGDGVADVERLQSEGYNIPMYIVRGNCDFSSKYPVEGLETFGNAMVMYCHGHRYGVKYNLDDYTQTVKEKGAAIGLFGHTHLPTYEQRDGVILFNPGSIGAPRFGGPGYGLMQIYDDGRVELKHKELIVW